ncbi:GIY-YIG nuclease family protein [Chitiniphilus purpureus]|uniref:GIY-YIG nuclease family protein n=1 Tax=Chitiniphilus purpureus TaxID=2981137 RepID=A0ABY6DJ47_9NEIS|nr:GIY-YIG nuclease family protein [Chitiniphilus sp. CD1]UXY14385.1 GIY-YIG nuclease family protein [Chitiniphilus sp. CD1]
MGWYLYVIECRGGSLYTGIATDVARRWQEHAGGRGARYTRAHPPVRLLAIAPHPDRASALRAEAALKRLKPLAKRAFCAAHPAPATLLAVLAAQPSTDPAPGT